MFNPEEIGKVSLCFRVNPILLKKFQNIILLHHGYGSQSRILEYLIEEYVSKLDDSVKLSNPTRNAPSIMADLKKDIIPFLKTLDLQIITSPDNKEGVLQGPLEIVLNNCREASIYARALRVRRVMGTTSLETQKITPMTYDEAFEMIKIDRMETYMNDRLKEMYLDSVRKVKDNEK